MGHERTFGTTMTWAACVAVLLCVGVTFSVPEVSADTTPIGPKISIPIPTVRFTDITKTKETKTETQCSTQSDGTYACKDVAISVETLDIPWLANYIAGVYQYAFGLATMIAAVMMMIGGFQYLTAGGDASRVGKAKERIKDAVIGLLLALFAYVILMTINPDLVALTGLKIRRVEKSRFTAEELADEGDVSTSPGPTAGGPGCFSGTTVCNSVETCQTLCNQDESTWPTCNSITISEDSTRVIPASTGLTNPGGQKATSEMITALARAGVIANGRGYTIAVSSGFRPLTRQISIVCSKIRAGDTSTLGASVAWPGGSNHGSGQAADLKLLNSSGSAVVCSGCYSAQNQERYREPSRIFAEIMAEAGFRRYAREIWHFEIGTSSGCRCSGSSCPFPPTCP